MNFEIEFHPVGDYTKAGDAITLRYGQSGDYKVMVIDGGTDDSGLSIVQHIRHVYGASAVVSDVICTHPDADHSCGLRQVLKELPVERLWIHGLWYHAPEIIGMFEDLRWTSEGLANKIKQEYPVVAELIDLAIEKNIEIYEPFAGSTIGPFTVLSPTREVYQLLIPQFRKTPAPNVELLKQHGIWLRSKEPQDFFAALTGWAADKISNWVRESWDLELLREGGITAAENETSVVLYGNFGSSSVLLTGDAGNNALNWACNNAATLGLDISAVQLIQVPHHGSRRNVAPSTLNRLVGPRLPAGSPEAKYAIVSAPKDDEKHPRNIVMNAFTRRGAGVRKTQGKRFRFYVGNMPHRPEEEIAMPFGLFESVEAYD